MEEFNCTLTEVERIASQVRAQQSVEELKVALKEYKRLKGLGSCEWIECTIWCDAEFQSMSNSADILSYILEYNDAGCDNFTIEKCDRCNSQPSTDKQV